LPREHAKDGVIFVHINSNAKERDRVMAAAAGSDGRC
jgi:hypothetical protein